MEPQLKTAVLAATIDLLIESYVVEDAVTEELLDQLVIQATGHWTFCNTNDSEKKETTRRRSVRALRSTAATAVFYPASVVFAWTWHADRLEVELRLAGGRLEQCVALHPAKQTEPPASTNATTENVRTALQIRIVLPDPVECFLLRDPANSTNPATKSESRHCFVEFWLAALSLSFLPTPNVVSWRVTCASLLFYTGNNNLVGTAQQLEHTQAFSSVQEMQWFSASSNDDTGNAHKLVATGLQLARTANVVFLHIQCIQPDSCIWGSWRTVSPLQGLKVHWNGSEMRIQVPQGDFTLLDGPKSPRSRDGANITSIGTFTTLPLFFLRAPVIKVTLEKAVFIVGEYPVVLKGVELTLRETATTRTTNGDTIVAVADGPNVNKKSSDDGIHMSFKASTAILKNAFDLYVLEATCILQARAAHALKLHAGEMHMVGNNAIQHLWTALSRTSHWCRRIEAPHAQVSAFKCVYNMERSVTRVIPGKGYEDFDIWQGSEETTLGSLLAHFADRFARDIELRESRISRAREAVSDSVATSVGRAAVFGASVASPIGLVASMAAVALKDGVNKAVIVGKQTRGASEKDGYKFGDASRGMAASFRRSTGEGKKERGASQEDSYKVGDLTRGISPSFRRSSSQYTGEVYDTDRGMDPAGAEESDSYLSKNKTRYIAVAGSSVGATVGLAVAGPIGLVAGSLAGGVATQSMMAKKQKQEAQEGLIDLRMEESKAYESIVAFNMKDTPTDLSKSTADSTAPLTNPKFPSQVDDSAKTFILGDNIRGVLFRGKEADGRHETSSYKFGDFSRGLFSKR